MENAGMQAMQAMKTMKTMKTMQIKNWSLLLYNYITLLPCYLVTLSLKISNLYLNPPKCSRNRGSAYRTFSNAFRLS